MTIIVKIIMFIAHLPLSALPFLQRNNVNSNKSNSLHMAVGAICITITLVTCLFLHLPQAKAAFNESMAIDTKAISLANNVTADPPGIASIHYNPAGLSLMGDGTYISLGLIPALLVKSGKFTADTDHVGFHDYNGDKLEDPIAGKEGKTSTGRMYIPILDDTAPAVVGPIFGVSHRTPGSKWTFGYTNYAQYGGGWEYGKDDPSIYGTRAAYIQHLVYAAPGVSYRINNNLSIGASFGVGQTAMGVEITMRGPNEIVNLTRILGDATKDMANPIFDVTVPMPLFGGGIGVYDHIGDISLTLRDDFSPSYNLGVLWDPFDWITFGLCYQSAIEANLSGTFSLKYSEDWQRMVAWSGSTAVMQIASIIFDLPYTATGEQTGTVSTTIKFPQIINFGIKLNPIKRLSLLAELHWAEWSAIKDNNLKFDQKIQFLQLSKFMGYTDGDWNMVVKREFKDTLNWGVGAEYQLLDWLQLRAGYENRTSSTVDDYYDLMYALPSMDYFGAGMGIKWGNIDIDLALGYMVSKKHLIAAGSSKNMNSYTLGEGINTSYRGLIYDEKMNVYMASLKATMPLDMITDPIFALLPTKWGGPKDKKVLDLKAPVDSSDNINNMRYENKYYFIEDSA
jgi:long-subunit fatty acid transport protein